MSCNKFIVNVIPNGYTHELQDEREGKTLALGLITGWIVYESLLKYENETFWSDSLSQECYSQTIDEEPLERQER